MSRRSPEPGERKRDAERTRHALLDEAMAEFAAKGLAGARVEAIAARAGVNKQLISYYFGGKQGLYDAIAARWLVQEQAFDPPGTSLVELVSRYVDAGHADLDLQRLYLRDALDADPAQAAFEPDSKDVAGLRARQASGEVGADLDPGFLLLALKALVLAGATLPAEATRLTGLDPRSEQFHRLAREQVTRIVARLGPIS